MPAPKDKEKINPDLIRQQLKLKSFEFKKTIAEKYPRAKKFFREKGIDLSKIRQHSAKLLSTGLMAGSLFFLPPADNLKFLPSPYELVEKLRGDKDTLKKDKEKLLVDTLKSFLPDFPRPLGRSEEKFLEQIFRSAYGIGVKASLEGEHLNTTFGYIGIEQHLRRYPGDKLQYHGETNVVKEGMAPGLSAWGYFSDSKKDFDESAEEIEKWYVAVQTLYLPDWNIRQPFLKDWYKYRKVLVVNAENGMAVAAAVADSGPASWTGKQFGGSPEVMDYLGGENYKKGKVLLFFLDDPENTISLGPVEINGSTNSIIAQR